MSDVTRILSKIEAGHAHASDELLPLVYEELRILAVARMSNERAGNTLQPTALVHESYLRLVDKDAVGNWDNRRHFFAAAAEAMRRILVESARRKKQRKHGGDRQREPLDDFALATDSDATRLLALNDAIDALSGEDFEASELLRLRYFAGLSVEDAADTLGLARSTAYKHWAYAKAWIKCHADETGRD